MVSNPRSLQAQLDNFLQNFGNSENIIIGEGCLEPGNGHTA